MEEKDLPHGGLKVGDLVRHGDDLCRVAYVYDGCDEIGLAYQSDPDDGACEVCWFNVEKVERPDLEVIAELGARAGWF